MIAAGLSDFHISDHCHVCYTVRIAFVKRQNQPGATIRANMKTVIRAQANRCLIVEQMRRRNVLQQLEFCAAVYVVSGFETTD